MGVKTAYRDHDRHTRSSPLEVSTLKQNPSSSPSAVAQVHDTINGHPGPSTPPPPIKDGVSTNNGDTSKVGADQPDSCEIVDVEMGEDAVDDDGDMSIVPPVTNIGPVAKSDVQTLEQKTQPTDEEESELQVDLEAQRQRQRQARRGPTPTPPVSSPRTRSGKTRRTGMKRNREEYEACQVAEDHHHDMRIEEPGRVERERRTEVVQMDPVQLVHSPSSVEAADIHADADECEIVLERKRRDVDDIHIPRKDKTRGKVATNGRRQVTPPPPPPGEIHMPTTATATATATATMTPAAKDAHHPKTIGRWSYYTHFRDNGSPLAPTRSPIIEPSTAPLPPSQHLPISPQADRPTPKRHSKLGINHMDLLYKTEKEVMVCRICR